MKSFFFNNIVFQYLCCLWMLPLCIGNSHAQAACAACVYGFGLWLWCCVLGVFAFKINPNTIVKKENNSTLENFSTFYFVNSYIIYYLPPRFMRVPFLLLAKEQDLKSSFQNSQKKLGKAVHCIGLILRALIQPSII